MTSKFFSVALLGGLVAILAFPADAAPKSRQAAQEEGYTVRRGPGGYSYNYSDSINTYGDSRSRYGAASSYRDPRLDRQTPAGPFDHGFFFDSAIGTNGGDAPYMH
ncbi:hypothetical protein DLM45_03830 [Hyphomicrobium methylovorum]|uniref:hypothetical protein n=1 Tax=Hyphomicrobium methylovorum TaxID=84 RepID=UPI0015E7D765|nr:hypothetical protein [Hyphomicrobium methylovorum]MBA2125354.1 hypothetical protein [Hyphomicrobium methylovorum]